MIANMVALIYFDYRMAAIAAHLAADRLHRSGAVRRTVAARISHRAQRDRAGHHAIEETLASIKAVKAFGREASEGEIYARDNWDAFMAARRARLLWSSIE